MNIFILLEQSWALVFVSVTGKYAGIIHFYVRSFLLCITNFLCFFFFFSEENKPDVSLNFFYFIQV